MGKDKNKINPTPGVYYDNEEEARKVELARAQNSWTESGETAKGTENPNEMYGGDLEPAVFVAKTPKEEPKEEVKEEVVEEVKEEPKEEIIEEVKEEPKVEATEEIIEEPSAEDLLNKTYDDESKRLDLTIKDLEGRRANALAQDETAQRRGRSMKMIAGISDSLASLANLIGVSKGGSNIDTTKGALTPLEQKLEAARLERKADIKSIDDRLDQYRKQMNQVKMQKDAALAAYKQNKEKEAREDARFKEEMDYKKGRDKVSDEQFTKKLEAMDADRKVRQTEIQNNYKLGLQRLEMEAKEKGITGSYPVLVGDNEILDIPKEKINNQTIGRIFDALPTKYKDLARGKEIYEQQTDAFDNPIKVGTGRYEQPSLNEMLAAIGAASKDDAKIQDELRKLAGTYKAPKPQEKTKDTNVARQPSAQTPSWMQTSQQLWQNATNYNDPFAEFE
jgi:hypothetical protein